MCLGEPSGVSHRLSYLISPPSIIMPEHMAPEPVAARWLRAHHDDGGWFCVRFARGHSCSQKRA